MTDTEARNAIAEQTDGPAAEANSQAEQGYVIALPSEDGDGPNNERNSMTQAAPRSEVDGLAKAVNGCQVLLAELWPQLEKSVADTEGEQSAKVDLHVTYKPGTEKEPAKVRVTGTATVPAIPVSFTAQIENGQLDLFGEGRE